MIERNKPRLTGEQLNMFRARLWNTAYTATCSGVDPATEAQVRLSLEHFDQVFDALVERLREEYLLC